MSISPNENRVFRNGKVPRPQLELLNKAPGVLLAMADGECVEETRDFVHMLKELGTCYWSGSLNPPMAHVSSPAPECLEAFEQGRANWFDGIHEADRARVEENAARAADGESTESLEYRMMTAASDVIWIRHSLSPLRNAPVVQGAKTLHGFVQVIDDRKRLEEECIRVSEYERHQIGQELHDDVCQTLAGLTCMMEVFGRSVTAVPGLAAKIDELVVELNGGMARTRSLAHGLVPMRLVGLGLHGALEELCAQVAASRGVTVTARFTNNFSTHHPDQILNLYRIAQEAMGNAVKHGHATKISLSLRTRGRDMALLIRDNGIGCPVDSPQRSGLGLHIMKYRAVSIGGRFSISRRPSGGSVVEVRYPRASLQDA